MRKKIVCMSMAVILLLGAQATAFAQGNATVNFTEGNTLEYTNVSDNGDGSVSLGNEFTGIAPGETKYVKKLVEIIEDAVPLAAAVPTSDKAMIGAGIAVLALGIILVVTVTGKRKRKEQQTAMQYRCRKTQIIRFRLKMKKRRWRNLLPMQHKERAAVRKMLR